MNSLKSRVCCTECCLWNGGVRNLTSVFVETVVCSKKDRLEGFAVVQDLNPTKTCPCLSVSVVCFGTKF
jgi:hypothetical protein